MTAVNQALPIIAVGGVKVHFRCVLPKSRRHHMLGFFNSHAINMIDLFANLIVTPAMRFARHLGVIVGKIQTIRDHQIGNIQRVLEVWNNRFRRRRSVVAFAHHHPAHKLHHSFIVLIDARSPNIDDTGFTT